LQGKDLKWKIGSMPDKDLDSFKTLKMAYPRSDNTFSQIIDTATGSDEEKGGLGAIFCQADEKGEPRVIS
jgi:hypothetical protein